MPLPQPDYEGKINIYANKLKMWSITIAVLALLTSAFFIDEPEPDITSFLLLSIGLLVFFFLFLFKAAVASGPFIIITREEIRVRSWRFAPLRIPIRDIQQVNHTKSYGRGIKYTFIELEIDRDFGRKLTRFQRWFFLLEAKTRQSNGKIGLSLGLFKVDGKELYKELDRRVKELKR